jgi:hypothetical protein
LDGSQFDFFLRQCNISFSQSASYCRTGGPESSQCRGHAASGSLLVGTGASWPRAAHGDDCSAEPQNTPSKLESHTKRSSAATSCPGPAAAAASPPARSSSRPVRSCTLAHTSARPPQLSSSSGPAGAPVAACASPADDSPSAVISRTAPLFAARFPLRLRSTSRAAAAT